MKKLFTFLSRANNNSVGIDSNHRRVSSIYSMLIVVVIMLMVPSGVKGATTTMNFENAGNAAYNHANDPNNGRYYANVVMSDQSYDAIGNGAKVGDYISSKNSTTYPNIDISRLAFIFNSSAAGNNLSNTSAGFYLARDATKKVSGLYTGVQSSKLAILNLKPGDKVTINFAASTNVESWGAGINWTNGDGWTGSGETRTISFIGDLILEVNKGTIIQSIVIESEIAEYEITTSADGKTSTFVFTKDGLLDNNDYTLPNLSASFGSITDFLVVQNYESHMYKADDGTENLVTDPTHNYQPSAGSFYCFKPTAGGTISIEGSLQGSTMHLFVYDPNAGANGTGDWVGRNGNIYYDTFNGNSYEFTVTKGLIYYICQNNLTESGNAFHLSKFTFTTTYYVQDLGVIIENVDDYSGEGHPIQLTRTEGLGGYELKVKRCSANINPASLTAVIDQYGWLYMSKPTFVDGTDHAGTVIWDLHSDNGDDAIVVTFPYHADYNPVGYTDTNRTYGHTWNFIDPRNSDSNIGNCLIRNGIASFNPGTTTGILSIGRNQDTGSQFHQEVLNREWTYSQRQTGMAGGFHDPYYANVWDMVGDNADMIWETEGLWFDTGTNLSCIYNESDEYDQSLTNPVDFATLGTDPDRYVGLLPVTDDKKSSFTIPGLKAGDRVLIFMKSGESSGDNGIFLNITGAKDALGKQINSTDLYKAGGTNWQHERYEGCYHFIKDDNVDATTGYGSITFDMQSGSMCKLLYIRIYTGQRISTNTIVSTGNKQDENGDDVLDENNNKIQDSGRILFMNDKGAAKGQYSNMSLRFRGKGQQQKANVLTCSGNLNYQLSIGKDHNQDILDDHFTVSGKYYQAVGFTSQVGEIGMFRMREMDVEYGENYVADFSDRNFTVGYRDKVDSYPYTWDFTDIQGFSSSKMSDEDTNYPISAASSDEYGNQWDISLFDSDGYMKLNTGFDPITDNLIFAPHKIGNGNQLWAGDGVIPEARGLWFYSEDDSDSNYSSDYSSSLYNDCLQVTTDGIRFANTPDDAGKRVAWWNYKMVVPDVPADAAVYLRMKRDTSVPDDAKTFSELDNADVPFVATRFKFASQSDKTQLYTNTPVENGTGYSFFQVPGTTDEWIVAVKNTTGAVNHLTFTLNGWIVKKVAVSTDPKAVNTKGWTSESRTRNIDAALTAYLTGKDMKTYFAGQPNYKNRTLVLTDVGGSENNHVMPANTGCVIFNATDENKANILNDGFHLFVPDMHDTEKLANATATTSNGAVNMLKPQLTEVKPLPEYDGEGTTYTNYVLSYKHYQYNSSGSYTGTAGEGPEMFYRVANTGIGLRANSAYLTLPTSEVKPANWDTTSHAKYSFIFADYDDLVFDISGGIATDIEAVDTDARQAQDGWYNLNGQKMNGKPSTNGLYIVNGKKVLVK